MVDTVKVATINCRGLNTPSNRQNVSNLYKNKGYSIICVQETHFTTKIEARIEAQWGISCILFNNNLNLNSTKEKKDNEGNVQAIDLSINDNRIILVNIYGPNFDLPDFYERIRYCFIDFNNDYFFVEIKI